MASAVTLMAASIIAVLLLATLVIAHIGSVVHDESVERVQSSWKQKCSSSRAALVEMVPFTAIKILVTVWQIISQVCRSWLAHEIYRSPNVAVIFFQVGETMITMARGKKTLVSGLDQRCFSSWSPDKALSPCHACSTRGTMEVAYTLTL